MAGSYAEPDLRVAFLSAILGCTAHMLACHSDTLNGTSTSTEPVGLPPGSVPPQASPSLDNILGHQIILAHSVSLTLLRLQACCQLTKSVPAQQDTNTGMSCLCNSSELHSRMVISVPHALYPVLNKPFGQVSCARGLVTDCPETL